MIDQAAVMICGHGSRDKAAVDEFNQLSVRLKQKLPGHDIESGFLEFAEPVIRTGLEKLKARGAKKIICLPGMLFAAGHVKNDLPSEINTFAAENPGIEVIFGRDLAIDPKMLKAAEARVREAIDTASGDVDVSDTLLMVVGRGTNDPDANSNISKVARMLWEGIGVGWAEVSFSGVAFPLVDADYERKFLGCATMGLDQASATDLHGAIMRLDDQQSIDPVMAPLRELRRPTASIG